MPKGRRRRNRVVRKIRSQAAAPGPDHDPLADLGISRRDLATMAPADLAIIERAFPYTMTGVLRLQALVDAVRYCVRRGVRGDFAECGVWHGGSVLAMIMTLQDLGEVRDVYLFDTFEGMTVPTALDGSPVERHALETWEEAKRNKQMAWEGFFEPETFNEDRVRDTVLSTGYPEDRVHLVRGPVEETLPHPAVQRLALLRLDTDWYESTRHELEHLYPALSPGGALIVDDYGHWEGCRKAVDEYFSRHPPPVLLNRIDYSARIAIKH